MAFDDDFGGGGHGEIDGFGGHQFKGLAEQGAGNLYREHLAVERLIRSSDLDWTIVRPTRLGNAPSRGYMENTHFRPNGPITMSRADVAAFISKEVRACQYVREAVFLVSR